MKSLFFSLQFVFPILTVIGHKPRDFNDVTKNIPEIKDEGLWNQYGKHGFMHDLSHLKEEASKLLHMQETDEITLDQQAFYYTRLHDFNNDGGLDGLELLLAVKHSLSHQNISFEDKPCEELADYVDSELKLMDLNNDGIIDYGEIYTYTQNLKNEREYAE